MMSEPANAFVADAEVPKSDTLKVLFRSEEPGDRNYILSCWNEGWKDAPENRDLISPDEVRMLKETSYDEDDYQRQVSGMTARKFRKKFQRLVTGGDGVMWHPRTKVLVGCSPEDRAWVWSFCVFTPATTAEPVTIHWMTVRPKLRDGRGGERSIRRQGIATRMLGIGTGADGNILGPGVPQRQQARRRAKIQYTCRPGRQRSFETGESWEVWGDLISALDRINVKADYVELGAWLDRRNLA
jgi:hypothetical protein